MNMGGGCCESNGWSTGNVGVGDELSQVFGIQRGFGGDWSESNDWSTGVLEWAWDESNG